MTDESSWITELIDPEKFMTSHKHSQFHAQNFKTVFAHLPSPFTNLLKSHPP